MEQVKSKDNTCIGYDRTGQGQPLILVGGAFNTRTFGPNEAMIPLLTPHFTVINYDRRGRGQSTDTQPYAVEREVEDIDALIDAVGGAAYLYGISSGAALALAAANTLGTKVKKLAIYEAPFVVDDSRPPLPQNFAEHLVSLIQADRRGEAIRYFMTVGVSVPAIFVLMMRAMPAWSQLKAVAHTVPYDARLIGDAGSGHPLRAERWSCVTMPTLVMDGGKSPAWMHHAMQALTNTLAHAQHRTLAGQMHVVQAGAIVPALIEFYKGE